MTTEITTTNHDVSNQEEIDLGFERANELVDEIFDQSEEMGYDPVAVIFGLFCHAIHCLNDCGWSTRDLVNEVFNHTSDTDEHHGETLQ